MKHVPRGAVLLFMVLALCRDISAQSLGTIAGSAKDPSGAVLPGVTVEASSPALIEKVRTATTDSAGLYRIVNLPPGTYAVTFTLSGFNTSRREGVQVSPGFTATIDGALRLGNIQETVTVTGESPVVDVQNVKVQTTVSKDVLAAIPTARTAQGLQSLIPGLSSLSQTGRGDVGGAGGTHGGDTGAIHGTHAGDSRSMNDGMTTNFGGGNAGTGNNANGDARERKPHGAIGS